MSIFFFCLMRYAISTLRGKDRKWGKQIPKAQYCPFANIFLTQYSHGHCVEVVAFIFPKNEANSIETM